MLSVVKNLSTTSFNLVAMLSYKIALHAPSAFKLEEDDSGQRMFTGENMFVKYVCTHDAWQPFSRFIVRLVWRRKVFRQPVASFYTPVTARKLSDSTEWDRVNVDRGEIGFETSQTHLPASSRVAGINQGYTVEIKYRAEAGDKPLERATANPRPVFQTSME